jgi:hypothetical protein
MADGQKDARVYDQGYKPFDGPLGSVRTRFWCIAVNELRQAWKSKWFKRFVWVSFFPLGIFAVMVLLKARMQSVLGDLRVFSRFFEVQLLYVVVAIYFTGRRAVGEDLRTGALAIYFSRPVDFRQYLLGKWLAIAAAVAFVLMGPGLLLALFALVAVPGVTLVETLRVVGALGLLTLLMSLAGGWISLAISGLVGRARAAGIVWVLFFFLSSAVGLAIAGTTGLEGFRALGLGDGSVQLAEVLFGYAEADLDTLVFGLGLLGWAALGAGIVMLRLRRWSGQ